MTDLIKMFTESKWNSDRLAVFAVFMIVFLGNEPMSLGIDPDGMTDFMWLCFGLIGFKTMRGTGVGNMIETVMSRFGNGPIDGIAVVEVIDEVIVEDAPKGADGSRQ